MYLFTDKPRPGLFKRALLCFCGLEQQKTVQLSPEEEEEMKRKLTDTTETRLWRNVLNINAILLLCVAAFFHGFYA